MTNQESTTSVVAHKQAVLGRSGEDGVLIVDGMRPLDAVQVVEACGGIVYFARETNGSAVLDVHMDTPTANRVALATVGHGLRYVPIDPAGDGCGNATQAQNDNRDIGSVELTAEAVARVMQMQQGFFGGGADWTGDILPTLKYEGIGLVAVAAAQDAHKRVGAWGVALTMANFLFLARLRGEHGCFGAEDEHANRAIAMIRDIQEKQVDTSCDDVRDELYDCTARVSSDCSLFGYCMLQVAQAALWVDRDDPDPFAWPALHIANELAARAGREAALEFAASLRHATEHSFGAEFVSSLLRHAA